MVQTKQNEYQDLSPKELIKLEHADYAHEPNRGYLVCKKIKMEFRRRGHEFHASCAYATARYWQGFKHGREHVGN